MTRANRWVAAQGGALVLDTTAADIQPLGTQAAGGAGKAADAGHVHPTTGVLLSGATAGGDLGGTYPNPSVTATHLTAALPIAQGGTAAATAAGALAALGADAKYLALNGAAGGDLSGTYPNPGVGKVAGAAVSGSPALGSVLQATSGSAAQWQKMMPLWLTQRYGAGGLLAATGDPGTLAGASASFVSQTVYAVKCYVYAAATVTNVLAAVTAAAAGLTAAYFGIYDSTGTLVAVTGDQHASAAFTTTPGLLTAPLTSTYAITPGWYWIAYLPVFSGTHPTMWLFNSNSGTAQVVNAGLAASAYLIGTGLTGQSTLPAGAGGLGTLANAGRPLWLGLN